MDLYILDNLYQRVTLVDEFISLIWTERLTAWGDFEIQLHSTNENRARFQPGVLLAINESYRVMKVETIEDAMDDEGRLIYKVKGRSLEAILENRLIAKSVSGDWVEWENTLDPKTMIETMFGDICVSGNLNAGDILPVTLGSILPADTISAPSEEIYYRPRVSQLYKAIKDIADAFAIGFRITRHPINSTLYWDVYMGSDRTTSQTTLPAIIFSPDLENLKNTSLLTSSALYKNVAYVVFSTDTGVIKEIVYALDVDPLTAGFERNVLVVEVTGLDSADPDLSAKMIQKGKDELAKARNFSAFDGELANAKYKYGVDYNLGDLVEIRDNAGTTSVMQVTEQIFSSDVEGDKAYPTLSVNTFITPGSWAAWDYNQKWEDLDLSPETWGDQP